MTKPRCRRQIPKRREKRIAGKFACLQCDGIYDDRETTATISGYCSKRCQRAMGE
jgi:hypothetical protein